MDCRFFNHFGDLGGFILVNSLPRLLTQLFLPGFMALPFIGRSDETRTANC